MPGLRGPSDYSQEPLRHPSLLINSKEPFNAEPPCTTLVSSYVTPVDFLYKRNHGPVPFVDDLERATTDYLLVAWWKSLWNSDWPISGNRRTAMSKARVVKWFSFLQTPFIWVPKAIWGGAKLADVLELVGIPKLAKTTSSGGKHVQFVSIDMCKEGNGGPYKASIPLIHATNSEADVLLAYEMNGELESIFCVKTLNRDHGYPLCVIVPGVIGARSVKWLDSINIIPNECQGFFTQKDYKMFPPSVNWENIDWPLERHRWIFQSRVRSLHWRMPTQCNPGRLTQPQMSNLKMLQSYGTQEGIIKHFMSNIYR